MEKLMDIEALPERLKKRIEIDPQSECWLWKPRLAGRGQGYGRTYLDGVQMAAHRAVFTLLVGDIPFGLVLDHLCMVTRCVNPEHLEPVTTTENNRRAGLHRRKDVCHQGHSMSGDNVGFNKSNGTRYCRQCNKDRTIQRDPETAAKYLRQRRERNRTDLEHRAREKERRSDPAYKAKAASDMRQYRRIRKVKPGPGQAPLF